MAEAVAATVAIASELVEASLLEPKQTSSEHTLGHYDCMVAVDTLDSDPLAPLIDSRFEEGGHQKVELERS